MSQSTARQRHLAVACSGGRDSLALLHATVHAAARGCIEQGLALQVHALHVHHGLMREADAWAEGLQQLVKRWALAGLPVQASVCNLKGKPARGESIEAWARRERYAALTQMAKQAGAGVVLLAHHASDQAETFLLQALRGAGPAGLAAMPAAVQRDGLLWLRPWLQHPARQIESYVKLHRLKPVQDPSNADPRFARSRLRHQFMPLLREAFPEAEASLGAAASRAHEAKLALQEMAALDLQAVLTEKGGVAINLLRSLTPGRQANCLRAWLASLGWRGGVPESLMQRLLEELPAKGSKAWPAPQGELRAHRSELRYVNVAPASAASVAAGSRQLLDLSLPGRYALPHWGGGFTVRSVARDGLPAEALARAELRWREGGERFSRGPGLPSRPLKHQYQAAGLAAHERYGPLVWSADQLLFVPGLGPNARQCEPGAGLALEWWASEAAEP